MVTTIQISDNVKMALDKMKIMPRESYNEVMEVLLEDHLEFTEETKKDLEEARKRIEAGNFISHENVKKSLGL